MKLDSKIPEGTLQERWTRYRSTVPLVSPANKRKMEIIVVGTGLAGASAPGACACAAAPKSAATAAEARFAWNRGTLR